MLKEVFIGGENSSFDIEVVPQMLGSTLASSESTKFVFKGDSFSIPYSEEEIINKEEKESALIVQLNSDKEVRMFTPWIFEVEGGMFNFSLTDPVGQHFSENSISTDFEILNEIHNTFPEDISFFASNNDLMVKYTLLLLKKGLAPAGAVHYLGVIDTGRVQGFQSCHPKIEQCEKILLELLIDDGSSLMFIVKNLNQDEIDYIIQSI